MQLATTSPSIHTVQAEHAPRSHPILVPVRPSSYRSTSAKVVAGSTRTTTVPPFTDNDRGAGPGPSTFASPLKACALVEPDNPSRSTVPAAEIATPLTKAR